MQKNSWKQKRLTITNGIITLDVGDNIRYDAGIDEYKGGWKILGAENGNLLIMSTEDVATLELYGLNGSKTGIKYGLLNSIDRLNEICAPFGKGKGAISARSITVQDINKLNKYIKSFYAEKELFEYGNEITFSWDKDNYGEINYTSTNGNNGELIWNHRDGFNYVDFEIMRRKIIKYNDRIPNIKNTLYSYNILKWIDSKKAQKMFSLEDSFWLASPYTACISTGGLSYGLFKVHGGYVTYDEFYYSYGEKNAAINGVRAVVELSPDIEFSEPTCWEFKA